MVTREEEARTKHVEFTNAVTAYNGSPPLTVGDLKAMLIRCNVPDNAKLYAYGDAEGNSYARVLALSYFDQAEDYRGQATGPVLEITPAD
jgi:hypothetical protein